jgi:hypothetical protein
MLYSVLVASHKLIGLQIHHLGTRSTFPLCVILIHRIWSAPSPAAVLDLVPNPSVHAAPATAQHRNNPRLLRRPPASCAAPTDFLPVPHQAPRELRGGRPGLETVVQHRFPHGCSRILGNDSKEEGHDRKYFTSGGCYFAKKGPGDWVAR